MRQRDFLAQDSRVSTAMMNGVKKRKQQAKSDEWDERGRLRTEQLVGINQALEILTSDENRDIFIKSTGTTVCDYVGIHLWLITNHCFLL